MAVTTVEGIGSTKTALHPVQVSTGITSIDRFRPDCCFKMGLYYSIPYERSGSQNLMAPSVGFALQELWCPCMPCWGTILYQHTKRWKVPLKVSLRSSLVALIPGFRSIKRLRVFHLLRPYMGCYSSSSYSYPKHFKSRRYLFVHLCQVVQRRYKGWITLSLWMNRYPGNKFQ